MTTMFIAVQITPEINKELCNNTRKDNKSRNALMMDSMYIYQNREFFLGVEGHSAPKQLLLELLLSTESSLIKFLGNLGDIPKMWRVA